MKPPRDIFAALRLQTFGLHQYSVAENSLGVECIWIRYANDEESIVEVQDLDLKKRCIDFIKSNPDA